MGGRPPAGGKGRRVLEGRTLHVVLDVDTGTDDAGALLLAATHPRVRLEAALATWGNCDRDRVADNTRAVLDASGCHAPVHLGAATPSGPAPFTFSADEVMGSDGLCGVSGAGAGGGGAGAHSEPAAEAIVRRASEAPGTLTLVALAPLTTVAQALALDPSLPRRLDGLVVMGGAIAVGGNVTPAAESNVAHDPEAAAKVIDAFGAPGAMAGGRLPRLVPLDVTRPAALTRRELDALAASPVPGAGLVHRVFSAAWPTGLLETGRRDVWPAHDLLAMWCALDPGVCRWEAMPLAVDLGGHEAWGSVVADRSIARKTVWDATAGLDTLAEVDANRWEVAMDVDVERYHTGVRAWLAEIEAPLALEDKTTDFVR